MTIRTVLTSGLVVLALVASASAAPPTRFAVATDSAPLRFVADTVADITFDDLKFEMNKEDPFERSMLTSSIEELDGKKIRIRGYILPTSVFTKTNITRFIFVRDNQECCFGPGAALYDCIAIEMAPGKTAEFNIFPVAVEGTFSVKEFKGPGGRHLAIYHMLADSVK